MRLYLKSVLAIGILCVAGTASADVLVQCHELGGAGNTWLEVVSPGSETAVLADVSNVSVVDTNDNKWTPRRNTPIGTGWDSFHTRGASDDAPIMSITTDGLAAGAQYEVYVRYFAFTGQGGVAWMGNFGLTTGNMTTFNGNTVDHTVIAVSPARSDMMLRESPLATTTSTAGGSLTVYFDDNGVNEGHVNGIRLVNLEAPITWGVDDSGSWTNDTNWVDGEHPDSNLRAVVFGDVITAAQTVFTNSAVTAKAIQFDNANQYVIAGAGSVNLEADSGNASIDVVAGSHQFQAEVNLVSNTDVDVATGLTLSMNNKLDLSGNTLTKTGDGTLSINNKLTTGGGTVVGLAGTIGGDGAVGGDLTNTSATVAPGTSPGTLTVGGNFSQAAGGTLAIELAGTAAGEFDVLEVLGSAGLGGTLDVTELYTPGGADAWTILTAVGGITGGFDTITAGYQVALANSDTELVLSLSGALLPGDANGDGCVDDLDLTALAVHWQQSTNLWEDGDFNGDGIVDDLDLTALAVNWQQGCGGGGSLAAANVPEPATLSLMAFAGVAIFRRRR